MKKIVLVIVLALLWIGTLASASKIRNLQEIVYVGPPPAQFQSIQEAVNAVEDGVIIEVDWKATPYYENVTVNKTVTIRKRQNVPPGFYPTVDGVNGAGTVFNVVSPNVEISGFIIRNGGHGIMVSNDSARITNNTITSCYRGILFDHSYNNTLRSNSLVDNILNFRVFFLGPSYDINHLIHDIDSTNTVDGKPVYYWVNEQDRTVPSDAGYVSFVNCTRVTARGLDLSQDFLVAFSDNVTIENMVFLNKSVKLINTTNSIIQNLTFELDEPNQSSALYVLYSEQNTIQNNSLSAYVGVGMDYSSFNRILDNTVSNCFGGIDLTQCLNNTLVGNSIITNNMGLSLQSGATNNIIFHNNFVYNDVEQVFLSVGNVNNRFDNGYEGNYWSDYVGNDFNRDGIGDTSYSIEPPFNHDNCPLVKPWKSLRTYEPEEDFNVETVDQVLTTLSNSTLAAFYLNREWKYLTLNTTSGYGGFVNVTIPRRWLDSSFTVLVDEEAANFTYTADADFSLLHIVLDHGTHRLKIIGSELGKIRGDLDGDGDVDIFDVVLMTGNYGNEAPSQFGLRETP